MAAGTGAIGLLLSRVERVRIREANSDDAPPPAGIGTHPVGRQHA